MKNKPFYQQDIVKISGSKELDLLLWKLEYELEEDNYIQALKTMAELFRKQYEK